MIRAMAIGGRLVSTATVLALVGAIAACGGDTAEPAEPPGSSGPRSPHAG